MGPMGFKKSLDLEESGARGVRSLRSRELGKSGVQEKCGHVELKVRVNITPPQIFPEEEMFRGEG